MLFKRNNFDLIVSLGKDCACSWYLRKFNLQIESYPLDWLTHATFDCRVKMLVNNFESFLQKSNIKLLEKSPLEPSHDDGHDYYEDTLTGFYFYHDFPAFEDFDKSFDTVKARYTRRINRLYERIDESYKILFVFYGRGEDLTNEQIVKAKVEIDKKFKNKKIYLLVTENIPEQLEFQEEYLDAKTIKVKYDFMSHDLADNKNRWKGNEELNNRLFSQLKLQVPLKKKLLRVLFNIIIKYPTNIIPNKYTRRNVREKLKQKLFKNL